jgi:hypothetical protein
MTALSKFLVLLGIFLSASLGDAFVNHARLNHLIQFDASMSNPTNEPSCFPYRKPTNDQINDQTTIQRLEWNAELSNIHSSKREQAGCIASVQSCGLCHGKISESGLLLRQPVQYEKEIVQSSPAVDAFSQQAFHSFQYANINHKQ